MRIALKYYQKYDCKSFNACSMPMGNILEAHLDFLFKVCWAVIPQ